jgi:hypothetical protein
MENNKSHTHLDLLRNVQFGKKYLNTDENEMIPDGSQAINAECTGSRCGLSVIFFIPE